MNGNQPELSVFVELCEAHPGVTVGWLLIEHACDGALVVLQDGHMLDVTGSKLVDLFVDLHRKRGVKRFVLDAPGGWADLIRHHLRHFAPGIRIVGLRG